MMGLSEQIMSEKNNWMDNVWNPGAMHSNGQC